ncbi:hypothetical protein TSOC_011597 [Tetrabaena socialis]|uniref:Uncharacterized protein n=1 Tax=Tetrabaena socialis TaxID=47790 RepID=A0A2J7ZQ77_9CHLO|nr:hypothetical protein TSOC_011597 [Tetrabaena socialis]|eukprot:PNH02421.1 hypothetical protein TSOC_011597 [Tetrabaena socialis]
MPVQIGRHESLGASDSAVANTGAGLVLVALEEVRSLAPRSSWLTSRSSSASIFCMFSMSLPSELYFSNTVMATDVSWLKNEFCRSRTCVK